jgi:hypothetical protein
MASKQTEERKPSKKKTPTFLLELPLAFEAGQATRLRGHLEAGRQFYNAVLSEGHRRLRQMRADPAWQAARAIPRTHPQERRAAFKEGQVLPQSMGIPRAGARLPQSRSEATQELLFLSRRGNVEAWKHRSEPPVLEPGESSVR